MTIAKEMGSGEKSFPVSVVLSIVTGRLLCADISEVVELTRFIFGEGSASDSWAQEPAKQYILDCCPEIQYAVELAASMDDSSDWNEFVESFIKELGSDVIIVRKAISPRE